MPKVSVVIPVYNVEDYLRQCLDSVANQTLRDIEIICVDDGSTDSSPAILAEYAAKDARIKVLTLGHANAGAARNAGIDAATGEYLGFVDSDDWCDPELFEKAYAKAKADDANVVSWGYRAVDTRTGKASEKRIPTGREPPLQPFCYAPWARIAKRDFIESSNLRFQEIARANDVYFCAMANALATSSSVIGESLYCYRTGTGTNLQSGNGETPDTILSAWIAISDGLAERGLREAHSAGFAQACVNTLFYTLNTISDAQAYGNFFRTLRELFVSDPRFSSISAEDVANPNSRAQLKWIRECETPLEFLALTAKHYRDQFSAVWWDQQALRKKLARAEAELAKLEKKIEETSSLSEKRSQYIASCEDRIEKLNAELGKANRSWFGGRAKSLVRRMASPFGKSRPAGQNGKQAEPYDGLVLSVVMAVYNVEPFLPESIESILKQDIGRNALELILVDDGSTDGSGRICDEYAARHPNTIKALHKENGGVATARNEGIKLARGRYITFTDADDLLTPSTCRLACRFLDKMPHLIDIAAIPIYLFDGASGEHILNYRFKRGTRVIDLDKYPDMPVLTMSAAFAKTDLVRKFGFDTRLAYAEDTKLALSIQTVKRRLGVVAEAGYKYRKRTTGGQSALQGSTGKAKWYLPPMRYHHDSWKEPIPKFVQWALAYDLQWRFKQESIPANLLSADERKEYKDLVAAVLKRIDDKFIFAQKHCTGVDKIFALSLKYDGRVPQKRIDAMKKWLPIRLEFLTRTDKGWLVEGSLPVYSGIEWNIPLTPCPDKTVRLDEIAAVRHSFKIELEDKGRDYDFEFPFGVMQFTLNFPVTGKYPGSYVHCRGLELSVSGPRRLTVSKVGFLRHLKHELKWLKTLCANHRIARCALASRILLSLVRPFKKKRTWLICDRLTDAGDNGEALFRHIAKHPVKGVEAVFAVGRSSPKFAELSRIGPVVDTQSYRYKFRHLLADVLVSSQADLVVLRPQAYPDFYRDLLWNRPFVFLQHGVTQNDLSGWLNRRSKNIKGFVTVSKPEYDSIVDGDYEYGENEVWLTGFARFDNLVCNHRKEILLMPTWRKSLVGEMDRKSGIWKLAEGFENSVFFANYDRLINHPRLLERCRRLGFRIALVLHPNLREAAKFFHLNDVAYIPGADATYSRLFSDSSLMVTDYSSTAFDFAYLRKPVVYIQFDADSFFGCGHTLKRGYFDYSRDGFGEIEPAADCAAERIIEYLDAGCKTKPEYLERMDRFFAFSDRNNSQRIVEKICRSFS